MSETTKLVYTSRFTSPKIILYYRTLVAGILLFTVISNRILRTLEGEPLNNFKYFSIHNLHFLLLWYVLALLWREDEHRYDKLKGRLRGALLTYTVVVTIVYYLILFTTQKSGIEGFNDVVIHLMGTVFLIIDFVLTGEVFEWSYVVSWLTYPLGFLTFSIFYDLVGGDPIYNFLTMDPLSGYLTWVMILISVFIMFGLLWIGISKLLFKEQD